jgi:hypothetical protein
MIAVKAFDAISPGLVPFVYEWFSLGPMIRVTSLKGIDFSIDLNSQRMMAAFSIGFKRFLARSGRVPA